MAKFFKTIASKKVFVEIRKTFLVILGTFLLSIGTGIFLGPFKINSGGVNGLSIILVNFNILSLDIWSYILSWSLFLIGTLVLGFKFTYNTLLSTIFFPIFMTIFTRTDFGVFFTNLLCGHDGDSSLIDGVVNVTAQIDDIGRLLVIAIIGGGFTGIGCGLSFIGGGSTGGLDIISLILKKLIGLSISVSSFVMDSSIIIVGMFISLLNPNLIYQDKSYYLILSFLGIITALVHAQMLEVTYAGNSKGYICDIVTEKINEIGDFVINTMDRTYTLFDVKGGYSENRKYVMRVIITRREYQTLKEFIDRTDPHAFVVYSTHSHVTGEGFNEVNISKGGIISDFKKLINKNKEKDGK